MLNRAYKNLGDYSAERQKWAKAAKYYKLCNDYECLSNSYYKLEDFEALALLIESLPQASPMLEGIGETFKNMGLCKEAVDAFVKFGDVKRAVDCCILLNQWHLAVELAETHNLVQIEPLLQRYA